MIGCGEPQEDDDESGASSEHPPAWASFAQHPCEADDDVPKAPKEISPQTSSFGSARNTATDTVLEYSNRAYQLLRGTSLRVRPLLSTDKAQMPSSSSRLRVDSSAGESNLPERIRNPLQRSFAVVMSVMGITVAMSAYQEVVLLIGISGCGGRESISQEECESFHFMFITLPLLFRQVDAP